MGETETVQLQKEGIIFIIKIEHKVRPSGHKIQNVLEQSDLHSFLKEGKLDEHFCRKDKETNVQMKFSCFPCRTVLESVLALKSHLSGGKHASNVDTPQEAKDFVFENGKWKQKKGTKRPLPEDLSKRERVKKNKIQRNIPILPQHTHEKYEETESYIANGLRRVRPYYFTFVAHAKGRWVGRDLWSVFSKEFRAMQKSEFNRCLSGGLVKVNDKVVEPDYKVQNNDFIAHTVHRHELPVTQQRIEVIHEDDDILVVDKPPSIPVHPCGRYRHNTVLFILAKEQGYKNLHTVHRLDRLTSGVLIFAKSAQKSRELEGLISGRQVQKEYVCRVKGEFPAEEVICDQPIEVISYKIGLCIISPDGKPSKTIFKRQSYKDGVSIVTCRPKTGRMHQIRVHLQYLGFPISNDPLYNCDIFGPERGKGGVENKSKEELISDLVKKHTVENWIKTEEYEDSRLAEDDVTNGTSDDVIDDVIGKETESDSNVSIHKTLVSGMDDVINGKSDDVIDDVNGEKTKSDSNLTAKGTLKDDNSDKSKCSDGKGTKTAINAEDEIDASKLSEYTETKGCDNDVVDKKYYDEHCTDCKINYKDPPKDTLLIYLHAIKYSGEGWEYRTKPPSWTNI